jgi:tetratricopeptide (TPR) repeat protein
VECSALGPGLWIACFLGIVALRHLLELLSARLPVYHPVALLLHYPLAYLAPALTLALLLALLAAWPVARVTRLMLAAAALLLLPPLVDLALPMTALLPGLPEALRSLLERHESAPKVIGYLYEGHQGFLQALAGFLDPRRVLEGTTAGIRLEALLAAALGGVYVLLRGRPWWRVLAALPAVFLAAFLFFTLPSRFLDLLRPIFPGLSMDALYGGRGYLSGPGSIHDGVSVIYLTGLIVLVLLAWTALDSGRRGLREGPGSMAWAWGSLSAALTGIGAAAALLTRSGLETGLSVSVYDRLALGACLLASLLITASLGAPRPVRTVPLVAVAAGLSWATGAGYPALAGALALAGISWLAGPGLPLQAGRSILDLPGRGLQALAAVTLGYLTFAGEPGLAWVPASLLLAGLLTGVAAALASCPRTRGRTGALTAGLAAAAGPLAALAWPLLLGAPAPVVLVAGLFFGLALLAARLGIPSGGERALLPLVGACALAAALLSLWSPPVRDQLVRSVLSLPGYHLDRGEASREAGELREAERSFRLALTLAPEDPEPLQRLGLLEVARAEEVLRARGLPGLGETEEAAAALEGELRLRLERAAELFREALELDPEATKARYNLGTALLQLGEHEAGERALDQVLDREPGHAGALFQRAEALLALGRQEEAAVCLRRYLEVTAHDPGQSAGRARARELLARWLRPAPAVPSP